MKRLVKIIIFISLISMYIPHVYAESSVVGEWFTVTYNGSDARPQGFYLQPNTYYAHTVYLYNHTLESRPWTYFNILMCTNGNIDIWVSNSAYDHYFDDNDYRLFDTGKICTYNGNHGTLKYFQMRVGLWGDLDGTGWEGVASSFINYYPYGEVFVEIRNYYMSDTDDLSELYTSNDILNETKKANGFFASLIEKVETQTGITRQELEEKAKQTQALKDINDTMKDSEIDSSEAEAFFGDFESEDNGGISDLITMPLDMFAEVTSSCEPINLSWKEKDIELPCGDTLFWGRSDVQSFRTIWQFLFGGPIVYGALVLLFKTIQNLKNPDSSKVEVMKL